MITLTKLADLFANYKDEILIFSLTLNCALLFLLLWLTSDRKEMQQDPAKRAIYNPKLYRKD